MEGEGKILQGQPVLISSPSSQVGRLQTFLRAAGGPLSVSPVIEAESLEQVTEYFENAENANQLCGLWLMHLEHISDEWIELITQGGEKAAVGCPILVVTDNRDVVVSCREIGISHFLPFSDLNASLLSDMAQTVQDHFVLQQTHNHLEVLHQTAEQRFKDVADQYADWLWEVDRDLNILVSSSRKRPAQGAEVGGSFVQCFLPEEKVRIEDDFAELLRNPQPFQERDYWSYDAYGTRMCWAVSGVPVYDETNKVVGFRGVARDISQQKTSTDKMYYLANNDVVTGLYNRNRFFDELGRIVRQAKRDDRTGLVIILDIDHFAYINETHGHEVGDKLLVHMAQVMQDNLRTGDLVARAAGDEFAIVMPDVPEADTEFRVSRILEALHDRPLQLEEGSLSFNVSCGIIRFPEQGKTADELFSRVTRTIAEAKEKGRNRTEYYKEENEENKAKSNNLEWMDFLSKCLDNEQERLVLYYQPIVPLNDEGHKQFYEVLVRMLDQNDELVVPINFIEAAEDYGLISQIDEIVATRAIGMLEEWHKSGRDVHLSVNISAKTFDSERFFERVSEKLEKSSLPRGALVFEITETALLRDMAQVRRFMAKMRQAGAGFALDDCGVGYSSFNYIRHMDLDFIKIDGSFVRNLHISNEDDAFVRALHDVAKQKKIKTVAEMVEHGETADKLKAMGIEYGQGFYFAMPGPELSDDETIH